MTTILVEVRSAFFVAKILFQGGYHVYRIPKRWTFLCRSDSRGRGKNLRIQKLSVQISCMPMPELCVLLSGQMCFEALLLYAWSGKSAILYVLRSAWRLLCQYRRFYFPFPSASGNGTSEGNALVFPRFQTSYAFLWRLCFNKEIWIFFYAVKQICLL